MGVLYDYLIAPDDAEAAATVDRPEGPGQAFSGFEKSRRGLFGGRSSKTASTPDGVPHPTVADTGIDPVVQGGTLEELLTGRPYEQIEQDPRSGQSLAARDGGDRLVLTLTDGLIEALAHSTPEQLAAAAVPWSQTEEFWGRATPRNSPHSCANSLISRGRHGPAVSPSAVGCPSDKQLAHAADSESALIPMCARFEKAVE
jgi:hypothetical protein